MSAPIEMVDLEGQLRSDATGALRDQISRELDQELVGVEQQISAGLSPDDFERANRIKSALQAARAVVGAVWEIEHR